MDDVADYLGEHKVTSGCEFHFNSDGTFTADPHHSPNNRFANDPTSIYKGTWGLESVDFPCEGAPLDTKQGIYLNFLTTGHLTDGCKYGASGWFGGLGTRLHGVIAPFSKEIWFEDDRNTGKHFDDDEIWKLGHRTWSIVLDDK